MGRPRTFAGSQRQAARRKLLRGVWAVVASTDTERVLIVAVG
ncbi:MAG: hypothetical protein JWQ24_1540 [Tardiphaga sp.]|nr:hypothetical protein [Tardiphaga sp.]